MAAGLTHTHKCPSGEKTVIALSYREPISPRKVWLSSWLSCKNLQSHPDCNLFCAMQLTMQVELVWFSVHFIWEDMLQCISEAKAGMPMPEKAMRPLLERAPISCPET